MRNWRLEGAVLYTLSPLSHNLGLGALITALAGGGELVLPDLPRHDTRRALAARHDHVGYGTNWRFFAKQKITFKKSSPPPSRIGLT